MKVSTKGRYALRLMLDIALYEKEKPVRLKEVAKRQELPVKYMENIVSVFVKAGFLKSVRGPQGGYQLTKAPGEYTVGAILRLTEGNMSPVDCLETEENPCQRSDQCVTLKIWKELDTAIKSVIDRYTLEDLLDWQKEQGDEYYI